MEFVIVLVVLIHQQLLPTGSQADPSKLALSQIQYHYLNITICFNYLCMNADPVIRLGLGAKLI